MTEPTLSPARWKVVTALVATTLFSAPLVHVSINGVSRRGLREIIFCAMIAVTTAAYAFFASGRYLRFRPEGLEVKERFYRGRFTRWSDIEEIGIAMFPSTASGRLSHQYLAGIKLREEAANAAPDKYRKNRAACGYDLLLEPNYGLGIERFVALLKEKKREAEKG